MKINWITIILRNQTINILSLLIPYLSNASGKDLFIAGGPQM